MNERKYPFNKLDVRKAVNYAIDRNALVKIYGGQGTPDREHHAARARHRLQEAHPLPLRPGQGEAADPAGRDGGRGRDRVGPQHATRRPTPRSTWPACSTQIGLKATVKTFDESVYWDTIATQKGDPQIGVHTTGTRTTPRARTSSTCHSTASTSSNVGNNDLIQHEHPRATTAMIDQAKRMPLGHARNAIGPSSTTCYMKNDAAVGAVHEPAVARSTCRRTCTASSSTAPTSSCSRRCT